MGVPIAGAEGRPGNCGPIGRDLSDAISAYFDGLDHGVVLVDRVGRVALCSARTRALLGFTGEVTGLGLPRLLAGLKRARRMRQRFDAARCRHLAQHGGTVEVGLAGAPGSVLCAVSPPREGGWAIRVAARPPSEAERAGTPGWSDRVTGLPDREAFRAAVDAAGANGGACFAVVAVALDRFRRVNDTLGHATGDAMLRTVAGRLRTTLRRGDLLARLADDSFAILLEGVQEVQDAEALARRAVDLLGRAFLIDGQLVNIDASAGVVLAPAHGLGAEILLKRAHLALGQAKRDGGSASRLFEASMDALSQARRTLEIDLRRALALDQFELAFQPQMDLASGRFTGCEALIRWHHPTRGTVSPAQFIPLAEEIGLIAKIGGWVLRTACREAARWPDEVCVAVNLSPAQFRVQELAGTVAAALADAGLAPHRLELEITEGLLLSDSEHNLATLGALRGLGVRISIDDFGTGYASLSALRAFPFDRIKIDRSFVSGERAGRRSRAIVRAIAELGATFGMSTVAEGVETGEQLRDARAEGCTAVQGYFIGRPMPAADIALALEAQAFEAQASAKRDPERAIAERCV